MSAKAKPVSGPFEKTKGWLDWYDGPSKPDFSCRRAAVDAHCHVFGPGAEFPYAPERKYTPCDASKAQLFALRDRLGFASQRRGAGDLPWRRRNRAMVHALPVSAGRARGVATIRPISPTRAELERLEAGQCAACASILSAGSSTSTYPTPSSRSRPQSPTGLAHRAHLFRAGRPPRDRWDVSPRCPTTVVVDTWAGRTFAAG